MTVAEGVDYAFQRPTAAALAQAGKQFAVRYGGPGSFGKHLTAGELAELTGHGIAVVANAEGTSGGFRGATAGRTWALQAQADFTALGMPADRPIYFSVDWDAGPADWPDVDAALRGAATVIGAGQVGVYGSYATIEHCAAAGTAAWFWQTYAWSAGRWSSACHLQQYSNGVTVGGATVDLDRAVQTDYGQWGVDDMELKDPVGSQAYHGRTIGQVLNDLEGVRDFLVGDAAGAKVSHVGATSPLGRLTATPDALAALSSKVDALTAKADALTAKADALTAKADTLTAKVTAMGTVTLTPAQLQAAFLAALEQMAAAAAGKA